VQGDHTYLPFLNASPGRGELVGYFEVTVLKTDPKS